MPLFSPDSVSIFARFRLPRPWSRGVLFFFALAFTGCGGGGGGHETEQSEPPRVFRDGDRVVSNQSDLVLQLPQGLPDTVTEARLIEVYSAVLAEPACQAVSSEVVDFLTAETCDFYHRYYLFPESLPESLEGLSNPQDYVAVPRQADPFTSYSTPASFQQVLLPSLQGQRATIGFRFRLEGDAGVAGPDAPFVVTEILPYTRAWFDGLQSGDQIVQVDGTPVDGLTSEEIRSLLPSGEGETVVLTVSRDGALETIHTASEVNISFPLGTDVAYLNVRQFTVATGQRVREDLEALRASSPASAERVILDLRGNGGGAVLGALGLADYLIDRDTPPLTNPILTFDGTILQNASRYLGDYQPVSLANRSPANLVALVDSQTASASEIVVAALRDYGVATVIGERSFGKGVRQDLFQLVDGAGLIVTSHFLFSPSGASYHGTGIEPDFPAADASSPEEDPALAAALAWLRTGAVPPAAVAGRRAGRNAEATEDPEVALRGALALPFH